MLSRFFSPPLMPRRCHVPMWRSAHSRRPISSSVSSTMRRTSALRVLDGSRRRAE
uniref:Uncharacterized protein n=1 Tax=Zea mays TaxID=4577 RepID=C4J280_MAIZE|nr:unknown [Zea mays]ACR35708.1 unknown [Zea mays]ACR36512.1 unknown [Zea mays]